MIIDKQLLFSEAQAVTASITSTDTLDLGPLAGPRRDIGVGYPLELFITAVKTATASGAATVQFFLDTDTESDFPSATTIFQSTPVPVAKLVQGWRMNIHVPPGCERYLLLRYVVATGPLTAGAFTAGINLAVDANTPYTDGLSRAS
ncbi:hypothetical protein ABKE32_000489 [Escherichia albertii]|uniref:Bbp16 family capsid cement protein n=1 Tax=Escherichia albertii TaxID=208962 RepID=UPI000743D706|nr:hypothetical protein [Escherichia albertii]